MSAISVRHFLLIAVVCLVLLGTGMSEAASSAGKRPKRHVSQAPYAYALGDSVMEGAAGELARRGIVVNAVKSRQFVQGISIMQGMCATRALPRRVVIGLGTNGPFTLAQFDAMMQVLRGVRRVVVVTVKEPLYWETQVNSTIWAGAKRWPNVRVADWYAYASAHPAIVCCDGMHIGPAGARAYAQIVAAALR
jgi:hypothetical protein